jgi:hypothetical protein
MIGDDGMFFSRGVEVISGEEDYHSFFFLADGECLNVGRWES